MGRDILIGITRGSEGGSPRDPGLYVRSVEQSGGMAGFISPVQDPRAAALRYDGFIIPGGKDLHPSLYHEEAMHGIDCEEKERVDFEISLLHEIIELEKPILGICYGIQLLNVYFGGTLYQDIGSQTSGRCNHRTGTHMIHVDRNPFIEAGRYEVPSSHHQAVRVTGKGMRACAYAEDGLIEGCYHESYRFLLGVQFHAERMNTQLSERIFGAFADACDGKK